MNPLHIAKDLSLPLEAVTQTFGILGKRGGGKSYTAKVLAEEMLKAGAHVCAVDPIGNWWGLRLAANGKAAGLPITVLGGDYGDIPLEANEKSGEFVARLIIEEKVSVVIDLSRFRKNEQTSFMIGWAETLYRLNREALHLFIDEADAWAPQRPIGNLAPRLLGAMEDLIRRGRARGLGMTMITQRSASINKDLLTQIEVLIAKRTIAPQDRDAIEAWVKVHGTPEQKQTLMESLASLPITEAWFWSPAWLDLFQCVSVRKLETFDSSATPEVGKQQLAPRKLADVDLQKLQQKMADTIERAKQDDPRQLRRRIAELEQELRKPAPVPVPAKAKRVEVPVLKDSQLNHLDAIATKAQKAAESVMQTWREISTALELVKSRNSTPTTPPQPAPASRPMRPAPAPIPRVSASSNGNLSGAEQRILDALAELETLGIAEPERVQVAFLAGYTNLNSKGFANAIGALRSAGRIGYPTGGRISLTDSGRALANFTAAPRSSEEIQERVINMLGGANGRIIRELVQVYPEALPREVLAERAGYSNVNSKGFANSIGRLRSLGFIDYPDRGFVRAQDVLFLHSSRAAS